MEETALSTSLLVAPLVGASAAAHILHLAIELDRLECLDVGALSPEQQLDLLLLRDAYEREIAMLEDTSRAGQSHGLHRVG